MADDSKKQFARWRKTLGPRTAMLVDQVFELLLPPLFEQGFEWASTTREFGVLADCRAGEIPLQRRLGEVWPTVIISFDHRKRSCFRIFFGVLPEVCQQLTEQGLVAIPRHEAHVFNGPGHWTVVRGQRQSNDNEFGFCPSHLSDLHRVDRLLRLGLAPEGLLREEVVFAHECMAELLAASVSGMPREWETAPLGRVGRHMQLLSTTHT
ncbi:MAG: hypothetical protein Tsb007_15080 [Rhizobacter sp.]